MIPSPYSQQLHSTKVVVFVETKALSDHFAQIMLTPSQYKEMLIFLQLMNTQGVGGQFFVRTSNTEQHDFPNILKTYIPLPKI